MVRFFDLLFSFFGILLFSPILVIISLAIVIESKLPVLFRQKRVGRYNKDFTMIKFRTMETEAKKNSVLTQRPNGIRVTKVGYFLRKYKIDELPQLYNVLTGEMSLVGPRPELRKYVELYSEEQKKVLRMKPGITDYASIKFINEEELLSKSKDPESLYIKEIMPKKLLLNMSYFHNNSLKEYFKIIFITLFSIITTSRGK